MQSSGTALAAIVAVGIWAAGHTEAQAQAGDVQAGVDGAARARSGLDEARAAFAEGQRAVEEQRWADAEAHFARAYELSGNPVAQYNRARALASLGRYAEATAEFEAVSTADGLRTDVREDASLRAADARDRTGWIEVAGLQSGDELTLDATIHPSSDGLFRARRDPGPCTVIVRREGFEPFVERVEVVRGTAQRVRILAVPLRSAVESGGGDDTVWIVLVTVGAVLAIGGAAVAVGVTMDSDAQLRPASGLVFTF